MDEEATSTSLYAGIPYPTGLREFGGHLRPNANPRKNPRYNYENDVSNELAERLKTLGVHAQREVGYPNSSERVDLALQLEMPEPLSVWIEVKCAWTYCLHPELSCNRPFGKHLYGQKSSAAHDFVKLGKAPADLVGVLLLGFDTDESHPLGLSITEHHLTKMRETGQVTDGWNEHHVSWPDENLSISTSGKGRVRCWFWLRNLTS